MFERYTEKARRVIFFGRYEASQFGSPYIETEHILLGILREDKEIAKRILPEGAAESIRQQVETRKHKGLASAFSVDLPLSNESKRVLAYGAEEAERLDHKWIGSNHLFLGLLREKAFFGAQLLAGHGIDLETARQQLEGLGIDLERAGQQIAATLLTDGSEKRVTVHGYTLSATYVRERAKYCLPFFWQKREFVAGDVVVRRDDGSISFDLTVAEGTTEFDLVKGYWKEECKICYWKLEESDDAEHGIGYTNGRDWLCTECYEKLVAPGAKGIDADVPT